MAYFTWIGKEKVENHDKEVPFRLLRKNKSLSLGEHSENLIVEGDNLEALKALLPYYYGKVKCIYIDPPYNTGNEKWVYNDRVNAPQIKEWLGKVVGPEGEDLTRHDKWLCMMYPRLKLLHQLLRDDGVIFISIDDNEQHHLRLLMDEIFGEESFINCIAVKSSETSGVKMSHTERKLPKIKEYLYVYGKNASQVNFLPLKISKIEDRESFRNYAKYYSKIIVNPVASPDKWKIVSLDEFLKHEKIRINNEEDLLDFKIKNAERIIYRTNNPSLVRLKFKTNTAKVISPTGLKYIWWDGKQMLFLADHIKTNLCDLWTDISTINLNKETAGLPIFANGQKPLELIKRTIRLLPENDCLILDSFAGSGTTAQAVMELNKEDGGNRKFILVELEKKIAREITQERVRRVAKKLGGGSFEYAELGVPLFKADGNINEKVSFEEMASYVYFTETLSHIDKRKIKNAFIGEHNGTEYYLLFKQKDENILNRAALKGIKKNEERKVVYADKCLLSEEILSDYSITFKQIPYQVRVY